MALSKEQAAEVAARTGLSEWQIRRIAEFAQVPTQKEKQKNG